MHDSIDTLRIFLKRPVSTNAWSKKAIDQIKKGSILSVAVKNQVNNEITFAIPVAGFGRAFDGPAIDPKVLEEQQKKLQEELQKRAEEERKRLEATKPDATKPAAPAQPAQTTAPPPK